VALDVLKMGAGGLVAGAMIPARQLGKAFRWVGASGLLLKCVTGLCACGSPQSWGGDLLNSCGCRELRLSHAVCVCARARAQEAGGCGS
jgi:hypothetical protein